MWMKLFQLRHTPFYGCVLLCLFIVRIFYYKTENAVEIRDLNYKQDDMLSELSRVETGSDVKFVLTPCDVHHAEEAKMVVKSARMFSRKCDNLTFYVISPPEVHKVAETYLDGWPAEWKANVNIRVMAPAFPELPQDIKNMTSFGWPCVMIRLFLTHMLGHEEKVIYLDTDNLFMAPPAELWGLFEKFSDQQIMSLSGIAGITGGSYLTTGSSQKCFFYPPNGVNAGVFLLHLARMRQVQFDTAVQTYYRERLREIALADQGLINFYLHYRPYTNYYLPCQWNYRCMMCDSKRLHCPESETDGIKLLHGHLDSFYSPKYGPPFMLVFKAFVDFNMHQSGRLEFEKLRHVIQESVNNGSYHGDVVPGAKGHNCAREHVFTIPIQRWIDTEFSEI